jgi:hypothetical protein
MAGTGSKSGRLFEGVMRAEGTSCGGDEDPMVGRSTGESRSRMKAKGEQQEGGGEVESRREVLFELIYSMKGKGRKERTKEKVWSRTTRAKRKLDLQSGWEVRKTMPVDGAGESWG